MEAPTARPPGPPPVRLLAPTRASPYAPGRDTVLALVAGDGLRDLDVRDGDHVVLVRRDRAEHGDLAAVLDPDGRAHLWKVYPEAGRLRLSMGRPSLEREAPAGARVQGVVVAVLRGLGSEAVRGRERSPPPDPGDRGLDAEGDRG